MPEPVLTSYRSARLSLPFLFPGQAQKEAFVNEALVRIDALVQPVVESTLAEPPQMPADGACYLVAPTATGLWTGRGDAVAIWAQSQWLFWAPEDGALAWDRGAGCMIRYRHGEGWRHAIAPGVVSGGASVDTELRSAVADIVAALRIAGIFA